MRTFTDEQGREWKLLYSAAAMKRFVKADVDALRFFCDGDADIEMLVRILFVWLEPQIDALKLTEDQFAECLHGAAIASAYHQAREEVHDFLSHTNPARAAMLRKAIEAASKLQEMVTSTVNEISLPTVSQAVSA